MSDLSSGFNSRSRAIHLDSCGCGDCKVTRGAGAFTARVVPPGVDRGGSGITPPGHGGGGDPVFPDLVVTSVVVNGTKRAGSSLTFTANIKNQGGTLAGVSMVQFLLDGMSLGNVSVSSLAAGVSIPITSSAWVSTAGLHSIRATADFAGQVLESNENNNATTLGFTVDPASSLPFISPLGIMGGGSAAWTNPLCAGRYKKYYFVDLQPDNENSYKFGPNDDIPQQIAQAKANNKKFTILLTLNSGDPSRDIAALPAWLIAKGAVAHHVYNSHQGSYLYQFLSWDPIFQLYAFQLIGTLCTMFDGDPLVSITMGGLGATCEIGIPIPSPDGKTVAEALAAWQVSSAAFIAKYAMHLKQTAFIAALSNPVGVPDGGDVALQTMVTNALALHGNRIGFENWGLNANSSNSFGADKIIQDHSPTNPAGFQMTGNETSGGGGDLCGQGGGHSPPCLRLAMEAGVNLGAQYLQVFGDDVANPAYATDLAQVAAELAPSPYP